MNLNVMQWFDSYALLFSLISLVLNGLVAYLWHRKVYKKLGLKTYKAVQRIHLNETPRFGGLIYLISLIGYVSYCDASESILFLKLMLVCLVPIIFIAIKEDLFHNVEPATRILSLIFVAGLFIAKFTGSFPDLAHIPIIGKILLLQGGISFFYILSMVCGLGTDI
jgi:UDP-N-acetylmuramyl pentapeptide phosphotransferase/UDP-N-acetylglucosamine-1-phosphate transferase